MTNYHIHHPTSETEFSELLNFVRRMAIQQSPFVYALPGDLDWWRRAIPSDEMYAQITIWRREDEIVGFGWISDDQVDSMSQFLLWYQKNEAKKHMLELNKLNLKLNCI